MAWYSRRSRCTFAVHGAELTVDDAIMLQPDACAGPAASLEVDGDFEASSGNGRSPAAARHG